VQKLREVAATFQARGIFDLSDFQRYLTQLSDQAPREASAPLDVESSNVVRLLTIHAAKGLEASIVFLADGGREPMALNDTFLYTPEGLACAVPTPEDTWERPATYLRAAATLTRADRREAERLLYVALTRAREHLICCGFTKYPERDKQASYADLLAGLLDLTGPLDEDAAVPVTFDDTAFPVRVWSPAALRAVEALQPPAPSPTLWETYREEILHGGELPLRLDATRIEAYARLNDRLQPLPLTRREGPLRIGVHRALCYQSCPRQYWLRYILHDEGKMSPILPDSGEAVVHAEEDDDDARMDGTAFGRLLHAVLQQIDFTQSLPEQLPTCLDSLSTTESLIMLAEGDQQRLADCLRTFMAMPCYADLQRATVVQRELRFLTRVGHVFVPGIIDLLALIDGEWWIIDYKTGRPSANHLRQVAIYALGILEAFAVPPTRGIIAYLDDPGPRNLRDEPITSALLDEARRIIRTAEEGIRAEQYGSQQGRHCDFCPFGGACAKE
jgi:ATP-dependent exoDNAse (exonuclease V) beta subunit